jgi:hypothetical protein
MEQIWKQLQSPEWWFTAVFMALIVGVAGNFAKDGVGRLAGTLSTSLGARIRRNQAATRSRILLMTRSPGLLVLEYMRCYVLIALAMFALFFAMVVRAWRVFIRHFPESDPWSELIRVPVPQAVDSLLPYLFLVLSVAAYWRAVGLFLDCRDARRRLIKKLRFKRIAP